jgi:hypothetical protein
MLATGAPVRAVAPNPDAARFPPQVQVVRRDVALPRGAAVARTLVATIDHQRTRSSLLAEQAKPLPPRVMRVRKLVGYRKVLKNAPS